MRATFHIKFSDRDYPILVTSQSILNEHMNISTKSHRVTLKQASLTPLNKEICYSTLLMLYILANLIKKMLKILFKPNITCIMFFM